MSPRRAIPSKKKQEGLPTWIIVAAVAVVAVVVVVIAADFIAKAQPAAVVPSTSGTTSTSRTQGDPKAPIAFMEFSDFQ